MLERCTGMTLLNRPKTSFDIKLHFQTEFDEYIATFSKKMGSFLQPRQDLSHEEAMKLGMKNEEDEVEKFVQVCHLA